MTVATPRAANARHIRATNGPDGGAGCPGAASPPEEEARGRFKSSPPCAARQLCCAPAATRQQQPRRGGVHERHAIAAGTHGTPSPTIARPPPPCPESALPAERPQPVWHSYLPPVPCIILSTVQLSAHGAHPTPCTIRGRTGLSRRGAPLGQAGERATTTLDECGARDDDAACPCSFEIGCCRCCCCCCCC